MPAKLNTQTFIEKAIKVHGSLYDYSLVDYTHSRTKVSIVCKQHGVFLQMPALHLSGYGCAECGQLRKRELFSSTLEEFITQATLLHGDFYDYSNVEYVNAMQKVDIVCPKHGVFHQTPSSHLEGHGCKKCGIDKIRLSHEDFLAKAKATHGDTYDYSLANYTKWDSKIIIICPQHGEFMQAPSSHIQGQGCPDCAQTGFKIDKPAILYLIKFQKPYATFWKVGITNNTVRSRFNSDILYAVEQHTWKFPRGGEAYQLEQKILSRFSKYKFNTKNFLFPLNPHRGDTECFTCKLPSKRVISFINKHIH